jgi:hypothetical protein
MIAAADAGLVPMRLSKAVALRDGDDLSAYMVLDELDGERHLVITVGDAEAFALDAGLQGLQRDCPMTNQFAAALVRTHWWPGAGSPARPDCGWRLCGHC